MSPNRVSGPLDADAPTIDRLVAQGIRDADRRARVYGQAGAGRGTTVEANRRALDRLRLVPRVCNDVSTVDIGTVVLGSALRFPVLLAPVGSIALFAPEGARAVAEAASSLGTVAVTGILADPAYGTVAAGLDVPPWFQLYPSGDRAWIGAVVDRVVADGCPVVCVTVDSPVPARRDRLLTSGVGFARERHGEPPTVAGLGRDRAAQARFTWDDLRWLCERSPRPVVVKGILSAEDAVRAVSVGVAAVYVSNHGGRELDGAVTPVEVLSEVVEAVDGRCEILVDGAVERGTDVIKLLALGADAVLVGRAYCWALAAAGRAGVERLLELLLDELRTSLAMLGCRSVDELGAHHVRTSLVESSPPAWTSST